MCHYLNENVLNVYSKNAKSQKFPHDPASCYLLNSIINHSSSHSYTLYLQWLPYIPRTWPPLFILPAAFSQLPTRCLSSGLSALCSNDILQLTFLMLQNPHSSSYSPFIILQCLCKYRLLHCFHFQCQGHVAISLSNKFGTSNRLH